MTTVTTVAVHSSDPVHKLGAEAILGSDSRLRVLTEDDAFSTADVVLVLEQSLDQKVFTFLREVRTPSGRQSPPRCMIVTAQAEPDVLMSAIECGVVAMLQLDNTDSAELTRMVLAVGQGGAHLPPRALGSLLQQLNRIQRDVLDHGGPALFGPSGREREVLRLLAEGCHTDEIAAKLAYSAGTVKNILNEVMTRHGLRSRSHAVAFAVRAAII